MVSEVLAGRAIDDAGLTILWVVDVGSDKPIKLTPLCLAHRWYLAFSTESDGGLDLVPGGAQRTRAAIC